MFRLVLLTMGTLALIGIAATMYFILRKPPADENEAP